MVVGFEFTILFGVLFTLLSMLIYGRLPRFRLPKYYDPHFSVDRFGVLAEGEEENREKVIKMLQESGAEEVREVS